ncbi:class I SAM-dependent methyltransferase [Kineococcus sp. SYSU DK004]|uniref:class I SAM-dependent methyltransferase n=1 Tax=Kineococcus sp. SYSU DK004 TaxID=3383125 RepID=UPI003D7D2139
MDTPLWTPYDGMAEAFARHAEDSPYNAHYDRPAVLAALGDVTDRDVLDAGCGPGLYAQALLDAGARVTAFDASEPMVDLARERVGDRARVDRAVLGEPLPYAGASFDAVVCALAVHYVDDRPAAFAELHRVLRPGGALVVSTTHPTADWLRLGGSYFERVLETETWGEWTGRRDVRFWREPLSALCAAATGAGFVVDLLDEPRPAASMARRYPEDSAKLEREPGFLLLRLRRLTAPLGDLPGGR